MVKIPRLDGMKHGTGRLHMKGATYEGEFRKDLKRAGLQMSLIKWLKGLPRNLHICLYMLFRGANYVLRCNK